MRVHADPADTAELEERVDQVVVAGVEIEIGLGENPARLVEIVVRLLHRADGRDLRQLGDRLRLDVDHDPAGDVVDDDRLVALGGDGLEVLDDPACRGLVVVGRDDEEAVDADVVRLARQMDGVRRRIRSRACDQGGTAVERVHRDAEELEPFVVGQRRALPRRPGHDEAVGAVLHEVLGELAEPLVVDRSVRLEGRDDRGQDFT